MIQTRSRSCAKKCVSSKKENSEYDDIRKQHKKMKDNIEEKTNAISLEQERYMGLKKKMEELKKKIEASCSHTDYVVIDKISLGYGEFEEVCRCNDCDCRFKM